MTIAQLPSNVITAAQAAHKLYYPKGPFVSVSLAQWAVESAWGHDEPPDSNNPFGIKAVAGQPYVISMTREVIKGISETIPQRFAKYASLTDAFDAHAKLLATSPIYAAAQAATNPDDYVRAMAPHYATAPNYAAVLLAVMKSQNLYRFDVPVQAQTISNPGAGTAAKAASGSLPLAAPKGNNMGFFSNLLNTARTVLTDVQTGAEDIAPVAAAIPGAGTVVTAVEGAAAAANTAISAGEAIIAAASPEIAQLEALFDSLFHITPTPQSAVLTPTTTTATKPATS